LQVFINLGSFENKVHQEPSIAHS